MGGTRIVIVQNREVLVDEEDYEFAKGIGLYIFSKDNAEYIMASLAKYRSQYLARIVLNVTDTKIIVDHINENTLDNRKSNLRITDRVGNGLNVSKPNKNKKSELPRGVQRSEYGVYKAKIQIGGLNQHLGSFDTVEEAEAAYLKAKQDYWKSR